MDGVFNKVPFLTVLTFLSYITYFSFKTGESLFYGSPISLIQVDFTTLVFSLLRVAIFLVFLAAIVGYFIVTKSKFVNATVVSVFGFSIVSFVNWYRGGEFDVVTFTVSILVYVVVYSAAHFTRNVLVGDGGLSGNRASAIGSLVCLVIISFFCGNYFGSYPIIMKDRGGNVIISEFKDGFLTLKCHDDLKKSFLVMDIKDKVLTEVDKKYLVRKFLIGECNPDIKYS